MFVTGVNQSTELDKQAFKQNAPKLTLQVEPNTIGIGQDTMILWDHHTNTEPTKHGDRIKGATLIKFLDI